MSQSLIQKYQDDFDSYASGALLGAQDNWTALERDMKCTGTAVRSDGLNGDHVIKANEVIDNDHWARATIDTASAYCGVAVRLGANGVDCYAFTMANNYSWRLWNVAEDHSDSIIASGEMDVYEDGPHVIELRVVGSKLYAYIDGVVISTVNGLVDADYATGGAGVFINGSPLDSIIMDFKCGNVDTIQKYKIAQSKEYYQVAQSKEYYKIT